MATIKDVARRAQVSISTVSRVLNGTARVVPRKNEAVLKAIEELDYRPSSVARALVGRRSGMIGLLVGSFADPFFGTLMRGVDYLADQLGMQVIAAEGHHRAEQEASALQSLISRRCDALIIHALALSDQQLRDIPGDCPFVVVNRRVAGMDDRCLWFDNYGAGYMAARYLLDLGHARLGWIGRNQDIPDTRDRFAGFCAAMEECGIGQKNIAVQAASGSPAGGYQAAMALFDRHPELTAVLAYNDTIAAGCMRALHERNYHLPRQCSVMGVDDVYLAEYLHPQLTTIHYPVATMGETAVKILHGMLTGESPDVDHCFRPRLVERQSVAKPYFLIDMSVFDCKNHTTCETVTQD